MYIYIILYMLKCLVKVKIVIFKILTKPFH